MTIRRRFAVWISKSARAKAQANARAPTHTHAHARTRTHTHKYIVLTAFPRQQWLREKPLNVSLYVHCLSCYKYLTTWLTFSKLCTNTVQINFSAQCSINCLQRSHTEATFNLPAKAKNSLSGVQTTTGTYPLLSNEWAEFHSFSHTPSFAANGHYACVIPSGRTCLF